MVFSTEELNRSRSSNLKRNRIIAFVSIGVVLLLLVFFVLYQFTDTLQKVPEEVSSTPKSGEWVMFRHDLHRTGVDNPDGVLPKGNIKWTFETESGVHSSPAVAGGIVYFGSRDGHIYALKADTGEKVWDFKTGSWVEASPIITGGVVYVGSNDGKFYALDALTGKERWSFETQYSVRSTAAVADGIVYVGADDYYLYALDAVTGKQVWKFNADTQVTSSPIISEGIVVVGSAEGYCYTLNARTGKVRLEFETHSNVACSPLVNNGLAYFTDSSGNLYAMDIKERNWLMENEILVYWKVLYFYRSAPMPPDPSGWVWMYKMGSKAKLTSSPALYDNIIYLGAGSNVITLNIDTQKPGWTFTTKDIVSSSPAVTGSAVYVGSQDGRFYALDRATGTKLWDIATGGQVTSSPALVNGVLYFGSHDGKLYAIE